MGHKVEIVKMVESSGNIQFFVRAFNPVTRKVLEHACHQTKFISDVQECIKRAWMDAGFLARYFGIPNEDIQFCLMDVTEVAFAKAQRNLNRTPKNEQPIAQTQGDNENSCEVENQE